MFNRSIRRGCLKYKLIGNNNYNSDNIFYEVLQNRGIKDVIEFLNISLDDLPNPFQFKNMDKGTDLLLQHIKQDSTIGIICDSDPDGVTSTAILYQYIKHIGGNVDYVFIHERRTHGILLNELNGYLNTLDLLVVPDAGSDNYKEHKILRHKFNIDVLIIDHHDVKYYSHNAIVINNQLDDIATNLSGAGMTYMFCKALDKKSHINHADKYLDLAALGLISDMMNIKAPEVQCIIKEGLNNINNQAFKKLIEKQSYSLKGKVNPIGIAFYITPLINAIFRLGEYQDRVDLCYMFCGIDQRYEEIAKRCINLNNKRKRLGKKILKELDIDTNNKILLAQIDHSYGKNGMARIVANSLSQKHQRPAIVYYEDINGKLKGSMASNIDGFMDELNKTDLFEFVAGHQRAAGLEIKREKIDIIQKELNEIFKDYDFEKVYEVDFIVPALYFNRVGKDLINQIANYEDYYGRGIEEPMICIEGITVNANNTSLIGQNKNTIRIVDQDITFIKFRTNKDKYNELIQDGGCRINIIGRCNINDYMGNKYPQIIIDDYQIIEESIIDEWIVDLF